MCRDQLAKAAAVKFLREKKQGFELRTDHQDERAALNLGPAVIARDKAAWNAYSDLQHERRLESQLITIPPVSK